jgi:hypothetical protein
MTPIMTPFLVRVRISDLNPPDQGAMRLYIAVCETEAQAMEATKEPSLELASRGSRSRG